MPRVPQIVTDDGEWSEWFWINKKFRVFCCHCGLSHDYEYKVIWKKLYWRVRENKRATAAARRTGRKRK